MIQSISRTPLILLRESQHLPILIARNLESLLSVEDAAVISTGLEKAMAEDLKTIELSDKFRRLHWKAQYALASSDRDGSEAAQAWLEQNPSKDKYAGDGRNGKRAAKHRLRLALAGIAAEVARFQGAIGDLLARTADTMATGLEVLSDTTGIEFEQPAELAELRIQAAEHAELAQVAHPPTTYRVAQQWGGLQAIAAARLALEPTEKAAPAISKARRKVAEIDSLPIPEPTAAEDATDEGEETVLALS